MAEKSSTSDYKTSEHIEPQEEAVKIKTSNNKYTIGIPKETEYNERRVSLVPSSVALLVNNGNDVVVQRDAGNFAGYTNKEYADSGAKMVDELSEIYKSDIVLRVAPPKLKDVELMKERMILISALHLRAQKKEFFQALSKKNITAFSYEHIKDYNQEHHIMQSLSEIVGNTAILIGAEYLSSNKWGRGKMLGGFSGVNPSEVVIIGAGTVAKYATRAARGFGAYPKVFDNSINKLRNIQNTTNNSVFTSIIHPEVLSKALASCDIAIGAIYAQNGDSVSVVSEEMVSNMKKGSVIIDVSIDKGGCFETSKVTSHDNPVFEKFGVTHYCVPNIPSRTPRTSSISMSNHFGPMLINLCNSSGINEFLQRYKGICSGVYVYNGKVTNNYISDIFRLPYFNLELMVTTWG